MKIKNFALVVLTLSVVLIMGPAVVQPLQAQEQVKENTENPPAKNAGRQAKITEVMRITDEGGDFYFKDPTRIKAAPDGTLFVSDEKQFFHFDKTGKFVANLQRVGEGPGEYTYLIDFQITGDHLWILTYTPPKLLKCDLSGKLIKEARLKGGRGLKRPLGFFNDKFYYVHSVIDFVKAKTGTTEFNQNLHVSTVDDQVTDLKLNFPVRRYLLKRTFDRGVSIAMQNLDHFCFALENEHSLFVSHTPRCLVKQVDLAKGKVIAQFSRKYKPVPYVPEESTDKPNAFKDFKRDFFSDITGMSLYKNRLWVFTSTLDEKKGILVDVFSLDGKYLDNFYLPLPGVSRPDSMERTPYTIVGDYLYIVEKDEEEVAAIVKYKLEI